MIQFMMDFELQLEKPNVSRAWISAGSLGFSYFLGIDHPCTRSGVFANNPKAALFP